MSCASNADLYFTFMFYGDYNEITILMVNMLVNPNNNVNHLLTFANYSGVKYMIYPYVLANRDTASARNSQSYVVIAVFI